MFETTRMSDNIIMQRMNTAALQGVAYRVLQNRGVGMPKTSCQREYTIGFHHNLPSDYGHSPPSSNEMETPQDIETYELRRLLGYSDRFSLQEL